MGGVIGEDDEDETPETAENVCGEYPEHTEPDGLGCCKRCGAEFEVEAEAEAEDDGSA